jgi:hypothetical protein
MQWQRNWTTPFGGYLHHFSELIGDKRTLETLTEMVRGIISAGSLVCRKIASCSPILSEVKDGAQRVIRFAKGQSTQRSEVDAAHLTERLRSRGLAHLREVESKELWLILDSSDLRKPYAQEMPALMEVRDLNGNLVPGYRTVNVLGIAPKRRAILYHRLFSSQEDGFTSEPLEMQQALQMVSQALQPWKEAQAELVVSWIMDSGMDDVAIWRTIWEQQEHVVCRLKHFQRLVEFVDQEGEWQEGNIEQAREHLRLLAKTKTSMRVRVGRQRRPKMQPVEVEIRVCPIRVTYDLQVRRNKPEEIVSKPLWLIEVRLPDAHLKPWLLITDRPVTGPASARHVFYMYRQRWAVEDAFKFTKNCLGWEDVQLLDLEGVRTLVALAWVAAGFLYELGINLEWPEVQLLARLGGWVRRKDRPPGKIVITRGLRRLMEAMTTQAFLDQYIDEHGALPPRIAAIMREMRSRDL